MYDRRTKEYAKELELEADKLNYRSTCESDDDRGKDRNRLYA